ncbi:MAG: hypothetical protein GWN84_10155 [Gammaproteobacteria bacterium]|nr:hypothetical protein [Gammaproteobacteria bacterium]NIR83227.1 hypothetical protein [Gammaproteobacteria bacterium]NIR91035.1 hypothetical protein [Gammaproteobacteria bacterium]NIU04392.1 hypothetical protein [Gammaproteobacteria bacterium]NIV52615.1 hypothetical protein [Gammaproteobacteria bacterium]
MAPGVAWAGGSASPAGGSAQRWQFTVFLDDTEIGYHHFRLMPSGQEYVLESEALFEVKFLFFNAYAYRHRSTELWREDCLLRIDSSTDDNGDSYAVEGAAREEAFVVETQQDRKLLPECVGTFAYWDRELLRRSDRMLNAQTGEYVDTSLKLLGHETIEVHGQAVRATRYRLDAYERQIDLWYSEDGEWLQLESTTGREQRLRYRLL